MLGFVDESFISRNVCCTFAGRYLTLKVIILSTGTLVFSFTLGVLELEGLLCEATYSTVSIRALTYVDSVFLMKWLEWTDE